MKLVFNTDGTFTITGNTSDLESRQSHDKDGKPIEGKHYLTGTMQLTGGEFTRNGEQLSCTRGQVNILLRNVGSAADREARKAATGVKAATTRMVNAAENAGVDELESAIAALQAKLNSKLAK